MHQMKASSVASALLAMVGMALPLNLMMASSMQAVIPPKQHSDERLTAAIEKRRRKAAKRAALSGKCEADHTPATH